MNLILETSGTRGWVPSGFTYSILFLSTFQNFPTSDKELSNQCERAFFPPININYFRGGLRLAQFRWCANIWTSHFDCRWGSMISVAKSPVYTCCLSIMTNRAYSTLQTLPISITLFMHYSCQNVLPEANYKETLEISRLWDILLQS